MIATSPERFALRIAPLSAAVANFCDHIEHNEFADRAWVLDAAAGLREAAIDLAHAHGLPLLELYAQRLAEIEARNVVSRPGGFDGGRSAAEARTWRDLQLVQAAHDREYHVDVVGLAKVEHLRHIALHLAKAVGAFAEPREERELLFQRLPDVLLFSLKLSTVMNCRLSEDLAFPISAGRTASAAARATA
jgi:hypothetical protein